METRFYSFLSTLSTFSYARNVFGQLTRVQRNKQAAKKRFRPPYGPNNGKCAKMVTRRGLNLIRGTAEMDMDALFKHVLRRTQNV